jgi:glucose-1-phosphate cytidylyltransferase
VKNIPIFILAGGLGTRISEETHLKPKPMIEVGDIPVLVHIMRWYYSFGFNDFVICAGYRAWEIKNYFLSYEFRCNDLMIDHREDAHQPPAAYGKSLTQEKWRVRVIDTGVDCMTGGRVARAFDLVAADKFTQFGLTYGDGLCDVDLAAEFESHQSHGKVGTVLAVKPTARFGELDVVHGNQVAGFLEKPESKQGLINGGFFFFQRDFRKYLSPDSSCILERKPLEKLALDSELRLFEHKGFWHPMDTLRDKVYLQELWDAKKAPWFKPAR